MKNFEKVVAIAEELNWLITRDDNMVIFSTYSPWGQEFVVEIEATNIEDLIVNLKKCYLSFDVSEETYIWLDNFGHGKNGAPYDMLDLYNDMKSCEDMLEELYDTIYLELK